MPKFNHAFDVAFEVISDDLYAQDVTPTMLKEALLRRIANLDAAGEIEWREACTPYDTYEVPE